MKKSIFNNNVYLIISIALVSILFSRCEIINPDEPIPAYITINDFSFTTTYGQGANTHNINTVWVLVDGNVQGIYEIPVTFPVLAWGEKDITIVPGIKINGIASTRAMNSHYERYYITVDLQPDVTTVINPSTVYEDDLLFRWVEGFEDGGISLEKASGSDTSIFKQSDPEWLLSGSYSGMIVLDTIRNFAQLNSSDEYILPIDEDIFLEMDYKCDIEFTVGMIINNPSEIVEHSILVLNATDEWKKVYVNLTPTVGRELDASSFKIFLGSQINYETDSLLKGTIAIDNLKLVHF